MGYYGDMCVLCMYCLNLLIFVCYPMPIHERMEFIYDSSNVPNHGPMLKCNKHNYINSVTALVADILMVFFGGATWGEIRGIPYSAKGSLVVPFSNQT